MRAHTTAALILARGGSKGIPSKNLALVGGQPLVVRAIQAARAAQGVGSVWVSTDDAQIAAIARDAGADVIDRPANLAGDAATSEAGWLHALPTIRAAQPDLARLVFLQCTSPFTTGADIDAGLAQMTAEGMDCALSVVEDHGFLWAEGREGGIGTNHDHTRQRPRRQDLPPQWRENGAFYIVDAARFEAVGRRFCGRVALVPVDHPTLEIDSPADLTLARLMAQARPMAPDPARLAAIRALVMDFDGVHTDDLVHLDETGRESVTCSRADGMGLGRLRDAGQHRLLILSKEANPVVTARAAKLRIEALQAIDDKVAALDTWLARHDLTWDTTLFVGNDINDAAAMARAGLSACPSDARPEIRAMAHWVLPAPGGRGALRALCDALLDRAS